MMRNYFINRNKAKEVVGVFARPQHEGHEFLPEDDKEIVRFFDDQKKKFDQSIKNEIKIAKEIRQLAIASLKKKKELSVDYKES